MKARDKDADEDPDSPAGQFEYSIVSTDKKFKIDAETGWLSTNTVSDWIRLCRVFNLERGKSCEL